MLTREQITANITALEEQGASPTEIQSWLDSMKQPAPKKKNVIDKITGFGSKASDFLFGSTAKTVGSLLGTGYESARDLIGKPVQNRAFTTETGQSKYLESKTGAGQAVDIAFTTLELAPGGGVISKALKKLPGGNVVAKAINESIGSLPTKLKAQALEQYKSIFRATSKESKDLAKKVSPRLLERGQVIKSIDTLKDTASQKLVSIGSRIEQAIDKLPKNIKIEIGGAVNKLDSLRNRYIVNGKIVNEAKVKAIDSTKNLIARFGKEIDFQDARKLRQILDETISEAKGFTADAATKFSARVEKILADNIRDEISRQSPRLSVLNSKYNLWSNVKKLAGYTAEKAKGQVLRRTSGGLLGGTIGALQGEGLSGKITGATIGALLGNNAIKYINSPTWKSVSAITKNRIADNIAKGNFKTVQEIFKRLIIGGKNKLD